MLDVRTLCLGVLTTGEHTGYEIKKHFEEAFSHFFVAGYGSIYPALNELTGQGHVACRDVAQAGRPHKKVYRITRSGRDRLAQALNAAPPRHKVRSEFLVLMYFARLLDPERLEEVLDEREREIVHCLGQIDRVEAARGLDDCECMVAGLGRAALGAQLDYIRAHRGELSARLAATGAGQATGG